MKKIFVTMMMIMAMTTAAVSAQTVETKAPTAVENIVDYDLETVWATVSEFQTTLWEKGKSMTEEEVEHLEEEYLKVLPKCVNKKNIKWISKSELKRALNK